MSLQRLHADGHDLVLVLGAELLGGRGEHLLVGAVDLDLGGADDGDGDALAGEDPLGLDAEGHGVEGDPLHSLDARAHDGPPPWDVGRLAALKHKSSVQRTDTKGDKAGNSIRAPCGRKSWEKFLFLSP